MMERQEWQEALREEVWRVREELFHMQEEFQRELAERLLLENRDLRTRIEILERRLGAVETAPPGDPEHRALWEHARRIEEATRVLTEEAPESLLSPLETLAGEAQRIAGSDGSVDELRLALTNLITLLVPELVELCEASRRSLDPDLPFFGSLDGRLTSLAQAAGLEEIRPGPGSAYDPAEQNALKVVRSPDPSQRDRVDRCVSRGFKHEGRLLKKAEVVVYL
jgi:hypothetical protein